MTIVNVKMQNTVQTEKSHQKPVAPCMRYIGIYPYRYAATSISRCTFSFQLWLWTFKNEMHWDIYRCKEQSNNGKGRIQKTKQMNFRKSSERPLTPFHHVAYIATKVCMFIMVGGHGLLYIIWSYFPCDAYSTTVQHGNWLKKKYPLFKIQNFAT